MLWRGALALIALAFSTGCGTLAPAVFTTGATGYQLYNQGKIQEVYCVPMEIAYKAAIRTMVDLDLAIQDVRIGEKRRLIKSRTEEAHRELTLDLETLNPGKYVRVIFKATGNSIMPDRGYSLMVMKEFNKNLSSRKLSDPAG